MESITATEYTSPEAILQHEAQLQAAKKNMIKEYQDQILSLQQKLALLMGEPTGQVKTKRMTTTGRKLSPEGRQRIREAQAERWNKRRAAAAGVTGGGPAVVAGGVDVLSLRASEFLGPYRADLNF